MYACVPSDCRPDRIGTHVHLVKRTPYHGIMCIVRILSDGVMDSVGVSYVPPSSPSPSLFKKKKTNDFTELILGEGMILIEVAA
jgi:hypothetical protein